MPEHFVPFEQPLITSYFSRSLLMKLRYDCQRALELGPDSDYYKACVGLSQGILHELEADGDQWGTYADLSDSPEPDADTQKSLDELAQKVADLEAKIAEQEEELTQQDDELDKLREENEALVKAAPKKKDK